MRYYRFIYTLLTGYSRFERRAPGLRASWLQISREHDSSGSLNDGSSDARGPLA